MPRVTVGMPAYNAEAKIGDAIESILSQTFGDFRLLIADNASTDRTQAICQDFVARDQRISYVRHSQNLGSVANYRYLARQASTPYFKWHASNDRCSETTLADCVAVLDADKEAAIAYPQTWLVFDDNSPPQAYDDRMDANMPSAIDRFFCVIDNMRLNNVLNGVIRTSALQRTEPHGEFFYADRNLVAELALYGTLQLVDTCSFFRSMDRSSATKLQSATDVLKHHDPRRNRPLPFSNWRVFYRYVKALITSDVGILQVARAQPRLFRRIWWARRDLARDLRNAVQNAAVDLRQSVSRRPLQK